MESNKRAALVLEGGGYKSIFEAGVLDVFMENNIYTDSFASIWGVSAGSLMSVSYRSRQIGRSMRIMLALRDDPRMMSMKTFFETGNYFGTDFMYNVVQNQIDPCDLDTFVKDTTPMYFVATDVSFGTPAYLRSKAEMSDTDKARASASMPVLSTMVEVDGHRYLDGGCSDEIPFAAALGLEGASKVPNRVPAEKAVVVLTSDKTYVHEGTLEDFALKTHQYDGYPYFEQDLATRADRINAQRKQLKELADTGKVIVLMPPEPVNVKTAEHEGLPLLNLYLEGRRETERHLEEIREIL
ncbi:patatin family protein [Atopobium sp. oral taxon 416]|uniref:patatin-like phospholipase family protein n=1 Tax=Atopobium sp. oral taxon 416 TaxID=712157 RepID=UPI001BA5D451|nr:patatin family protein [Atopobium sp. oral taxon 416]QUC04618.1 patatin family protein [Atopobium sp. oral taxon 416]